MKHVIVGGALVMAAVCAGASAKTEAAAAIQPLPAEMAGQSDHALITSITRVGDKLLAVGARGHILMSSDGKQWQQSPCPVNGLLTAAFFINESVGWVVGHDAAILKTKDGGKRWAVQHFAPDLNQPLLDIHFLDDRHGIAVGAYGLYLETADGGGHWRAVNNVIADEGLHLNAIARLGNGALLLAGEEGMLALSADGGANWTRLSSPYPSSMFAVMARGQDGAVLGGLRGTLYRTDDVRSGRWQRVENEAEQSIFGLSTLPDGEVVGAGLNATLVRVKRGAAEIIPISRSPGSERGAFADVIVWKDGLVTAGDDGLKFWPMALAD